VPDTAENGDNFFQSMAQDNFDAQMSKHYPGRGPKHYQQKREQVHEMQDRLENSTAA